MEIGSIAVGDFFKFKNHDNYPTIRHEKVVSPYEDDQTTSYYLTWMKHGGHDWMKYEKTPVHTNNTTMVFPTEKPF